MIKLRVFRIWRRKTSAVQMMIASARTVKGMYNQSDPLLPTIVCAVVLRSIRGTLKGHRRRRALLSVNIKSVKTHFPATRTWHPLVREHSEPTRLARSVYTRLRRGDDVD